MDIRYLPHTEINFDKWDTCIAHSKNSLMYAKSFYLNTICPNWDALIYNDYEIVMPLTFRKKYCIKYLYQPAFTQQLGIFSKTAISQQTLESFMNEASKHFRFAEIMLNHANLPADQSEMYKSERRENYLIPLSSTYEHIYANYDQHFTKSLRRLKKFELQYHSDTDYEAIIGLYKALIKNIPNGPNSTDYRAFADICAFLQTKQKLVIRFALNTSKEKIAGALLFLDNDKLYNMLSWINKEGKLKEANYFLYNNIIEEFAEKINWLDLEGSDLKGVAAFYKKMNPVSQPYHFFQYNQLPKLIRWMKS